jgi:hypothetical protein
VTQVVQGDAWDSSFFGAFAESVQDSLGPERLSVGSAEDQAGEQV